MVKLLLSSRAFSTVAVTDAFFTLVAPVAKNSARIVIIVNSVSTGKNHPQMVALQQTVQQLGYAHVQLLDVLTDDLAALNTATVIILNGGYEFLLLKNLRETHVLERLRTLALAGKPIYGISRRGYLVRPGFRPVRLFIPGGQHRATGKHNSHQCDDDPYLSAL